MSADIEVIWVQVHFPHCKPFLTGCHYRLTTSNVTYLDGTCENVDIVTDESKDIFLLGDLNTDWFSSKLSIA